MHIQLDSNYTYMNRIAVQTGSTKLMTVSVLILWKITIDLQENLQSQILFFKKFISCCHRNSLKLSKAEERKLMLTEFLHSKNQTMKTNS